MLCGDLDGWDGGWSGREVQEGGDISIHIADSLHCTAQHCKAIILQLKTKNKGLLFLTIPWAGIQAGLGWAVHLLLAVSPRCEVTNVLGLDHPKGFPSHAGLLGAPSHGHSLASWLIWVSSRLCGLSG